METNDKILEYFKYAHLPEHLQAISKPFHELAMIIATNKYKDPAENKAALRKLLESKDCAVRAML